MLCLIICLQKTSNYIVQYLKCRGLNVFITHIFGALIFFLLLHFYPKRKKVMVRIMKRNNSKWMKSMSSSSNSFLRSCMLRLKKNSILSKSSSLKNTFVEYFWTLRLWIFSENVCECYRSTIRTLLCVAGIWRNVAEPAGVVWRSRHDWNRQSRRIIRARNQHAPRAH